MQQVNGSYKELAVKALPIVIFFKNGKKVGEITGTGDPKNIQILLKRHIPGLEFPEATATPVMPAQPREVAPNICKICQVEEIAPLLRSVKGNGPSHTIRLKELSANAKKCKYCGFLDRTCRTDAVRYNRAIAADDEVSVYPKREMGLAQVHIDGFMTRLLQLAPNATNEDTTPRESAGAHFSGRTVKSDIDADLWCSWVTHCQDYHSEACRNNTDLAGMKLKLIDINQLCVVDAPSDARYAALSYVWGGADQLTLVKDNYERLTQKEGLSVQYGDITNTIQDAIKITRHLSLQYLWVDALCIKQDGGKEKDEQIEQMDKIYNSAVVTIVSTGSNANAEIPGLRQSSKTAHQFTCKVGDIEFINSLPTLAQALSLSDWDQRGWTLQEKALSPRLLIFTEFQTYWHCNSAIHSEDINLELRNDTRNLRTVVEHYDEYSAKLRRVYKPSPGSASAQYTSLLRSFVARNLTKQSDALNAFTGVLNKLAPELGKARLGLPTRYFTGAMLWQHDRHFPDRRREQFPSWSWTGWEYGPDVEMNEDPLELPSMIRWWMVDGNWKFERVNPDEHMEDTIKDVNGFFGVDPSVPVPQLDEVPISPQELTHDPSEKQMLFFWTSVARFSIDRTPYRRHGEKCSQYPVRIPGETETVSIIVLDDSWREASKEEEFDFIFLSRSTGDIKWKYDIRVWTIAVVWEDGVANRLQQVLYPLRLGQWESAKPQYKFMRLA